MKERNGQAERPFSVRRRLLLGCDILMAVAAATAISALLLEYGFYIKPVPLKYLHTIQVGVLVVFILDRLTRLAISTTKKRFLRENWIDFVLIIALLLAIIAAVSGRLQMRFLSAAALYVIITQVYILATLIVRTITFQFRIAGAAIPPVWALIGSFAIVILFGTALLMLPRATPVDKPIGFTDALFTATSATCVTGLIVRDTGTEFTRWGQTVILAMIQLGGLGIMVFATVFAMLAGRGLSIRQSLLAGQTLTPSPEPGRIGRMVTFAVISTICIEAIGAILMYPMWKAFVPGGDKSDAIYRSIFHSISAFCNAGFSLQKDSLESLRDNWQVIGVMAPLIVLGGLGFPVLYDLAQTTWHKLSRRIKQTEPSARQTLSLHSKMILTTSMILLILGAIMLWTIESASRHGRRFGAPLRMSDNPPRMDRSNLLTELDWPKQVRESLFQSVTARTAGFNTVDMKQLSIGAKLWLCLMMIIGGSPASTAGGMKTATLAVLILTIWSMLRRRERVEGFKRTITEPFVYKAITLAGLYISLILVITLFLSVSLNGKGYPFIDIFFEACSACGTVGLTCGVTKGLTTLGKYIIIFAMFVGRLGPLTLLMALMLRMKPVKYAYPGEEVILA